MDNTKTIITPNGYTVILKTDLSYGDYEDYQAVISSSVTIDVETGKPNSFDFQSLRKADQLAMELVLVEIKKGDQTLHKSIRELPAKDGIMVKQEVDRILKDAQPIAEEKKTTSLS